MYLYNKNLKSLAGWAGKSAMADVSKTTACLIAHMTYTQAPAACEKNIFHLLHFTQPVKNDLWFLLDQGNFNFKYANFFDRSVSCHTKASNLFLIPSV